MKISVPNMGVVSIVAKPIFDALGFEYVKPPYITKETIKIGAKYAPEFACFPLKAVLGDFLLTYENYGVSLFAIFGGMGPCRFGWYGMTINTIFRRLGIQAKVIVLDYPRDKWARESFNLLGLNGVANSIKKLIRPALITYKKISLYEYAQGLARKTRPFELNVGDSDRALDKIKQMIDKEDKIENLISLKRKIKKIFDDIKKTNRDNLLRVGIVGEFYMCVEDELNMHVESKLGNNGVLVDKKGIGLVKYLLSDHNLSLSHIRAKNIAKKYLSYHAGGESSYSIGYSKIYESLGFDGIVHISPFGCMPEIVSQTIMEKVVNIPILNLVFDEHTAEAGVITRIEAFCDLLRSRKLKVKV